MGGSRILARREVLGTRNNDCCSPGHYRVRLQPASPGARVRGPVRAQCWVLVQFQPQARFRSEGPEVSSPVREDGPKGPKGRHKPWRTFGAQVTNGHISPPSRTGLLTSGPSDLRVQTEPLPNVASLKVLEKAGYICEGLMRRSAIKDGVVLDQFMYAKTDE